LRVRNEQESEIRPELVENRAPGLPFLASQTAGSSISLLEWRSDGEIATKLHLGFGVSSKTVTGCIDHCVGGMASDRTQVPLLIEFVRNNLKSAMGSCEGQQLAISRLSKMTQTKGGSLETNCLFDWGRVAGDCTFHRSS